MRMPDFLVAALLAGVGLAASPAGAPDPGPAMSVGQAAVLGLVEGITEYLPVSSTGHLILAQRAMGIGGDNGGKDAADAYAICIQLGAILAVLGLYRREILRLLRGLAGRDRDGLRLAVNLVAAFAPAAVVGLTLGGAIKQHLFGLWPVVSAWLAGGLAILAVDRGKGRRPVATTGLYGLGVHGALVIGLFQCLAIWPGVSRSLVTIVGALLVGMGLEAAVVFSFLLGALTLGAGTAYDGLRHGQLLLDTYGAASLLTGFAVALAAALVAVRWMIGYLKRHGLALFGYYRVAIALVVGGLILTGRLH